MPQCYGTSTSTRQRHESFMAWKLEKGTSESVLNALWRKRMPKGHIDKVALSTALWCTANVWKTCPITLSEGLMMFCEAPISCWHILDVDSITYQLLAYNSDSILLSAMIVKRVPTCNAEHDMSTWVSIAFVANMRTVCMHTSDKRDSELLWWMRTKLNTQDRNRLHATPCKSVARNNIKLTCTMSSAVHNLSSCWNRVTAPRRFTIRAPPAASK